MDELLQKIKDAIDNESFLIAKNLINKASNIKDIKFDDMNLLLYSVSHKAPFEFVDFLMQFDIDIYETNSLGVGLLDEAIISDNIELVKVLVEKYNFDVNETKRESGFTPLMSAVSYGNEEIAIYLVKKGANIEAKDGAGLSVRDYAKKLQQNIDYLKL